MEKLYTLPEIDWASSTINRCGILPIYNDGKFIWLGFGVNKFSGNISTIGGRFDRQDHDLLSTAIREYNEETVGSLSPISHSDLASSYVIPTSYSYTILYNINERSSRFISSDELFGMLWLTIDQFKIILRNTHIQDRGVTLFSLGLDLVLSSKLILTFLRNSIPEIPFPTFDDWFSSRPRKIVNSPTTYLITDYDQFLHDIINIPKWTNVSFCLQPNTLSFLREYSELYHFNSDTLVDVFKHLGKNYTRVIFALDSDIPSPYRNSRRVTSIESIIRKNNEPSHVLRAFLSELKSIRKLDYHLSSIEEPILIQRYEEKLYNSYVERTTFKMSIRTCVYEGFMIVNNKIRQHRIGFPYKNLLAYIAENKTLDCKKITPERILGIMLQYRLVIKRFDEHITLGT